MTKSASVGSRPAETQIVGAVPSGLSEVVVSSLGQQIKKVFGRRGKTVDVKGLRFIPSTKVDLGHGMFQVMANTVVEFAASGDAPKRSQSVDSVVTVGGGTETGQVLKSIKIPALDRLGG